MLKNLYIHNYAIIDELSIDFSPQLNVITGETGAGKSILMGALSLILGDRADSSVLLNREKKCIVEGNFIVSGNAVLKEMLRGNDLDNDESPDIVIRREIAVNGKSRAFVNDIPVNLDLLRQVTSKLVDLHRQFDTLAIADSDFQREVLDALAVVTRENLLANYQQVYHQWKKSLDELNILIDQKNSFNKEYDYQKFLFDELDEASFTENELEDVEAELKMLSNAEAIKAALDQATGSLSAGDQPLVQQLKVIQHQLDAFAKYHPSLEDIAKRLLSAQIEIKDIAEEVERVNHGISYDAAKINQLNDRIATGYKLLKKHGVQTTAQLLAIHQSLDEKLQAVLNIDDNISAKQKETESLHQQAKELAGQLSEKRAKQVKPFTDKVNKLLTQVGMPNARIQVSMQEKPLDVTGRDSIEFLFDANNNKRFEPVRKVASGGELSRLVLSIKSLVAESIDLPTMIFDEIDTGISGEAAKQVGIIMSTMATKRQLITITHQPQIAGKANNHLFVYKDIVKDVIRTNIRQLSGDERITAIARMLSGEKPTAAALENAREMVMN